MSLKLMKSSKFQSTSNFKHYSQTSDRDPPESHHAARKYTGSRAGSTLLLLCPLQHIKVMFIYVCRLVDPLEICAKFSFLHFNGSLIP